MQVRILPAPNKKENMMKIPMTCPYCDTATEMESTESVKNPYFLSDGDEFKCPECGRVLYVEINAAEV